MPLIGRGLRLLAPSQLQRSDRTWCYDAYVLTVGIAALAFLLGVALTALACRRTATRSDRVGRLLHGAPAATGDEPSTALLDEAPKDTERVPTVIVPETVEALLENAKALADGEQDRGASLKQRAGWLLGFIGVTLSLLLGQARAFAHSDLGSVGKPLAAALVLVALVFILDAARWALRTLAVVPLWHVDAREALQYPNWGSITKKPEVARGEMLQGWVRQFADERPANDRKAQELQRAFRRLTYGVVILAGVAVIVSLRAFGV